MLLDGLMNKDAGQADAQHQSWRSHAHKDLQIQSQSHNHLAAFSAFDSLSTKPEANLRDLLKEAMWY